jgi:hypothetical protein
VNLKSGKEPPGLNSKPPDVSQASKLKPDFFTLGLLSDALLKE